MKKIIALMLVLVLALSCVSIVACGGGDDETQEATGGGQQTQGGDEDTPGDGGGSTSGEVCKDIPIYPNADEVENAQWSFGGNQAGEYAQVEYHFFSTNDSKDDVIDFYEEEMEDAGWENQMNMNMDDWAMTVWAKSGGDIGAGISAGTEDGKTQVVIWCGEGAEGDGSGNGDDDSGSDDTPSTGNFTWDDVPVYPGANEAASFSGMMGMAEEGDCEKIEWKYYEVDADVSDVADFYASEMPKNGWNRYGDFGMNTGGMTSVSLWEKGNEADAAYIWVMGGAEEDTLLMMWRGVNCDL